MGSPVRPWPRLGLEFHVFMGEEDIRQALNVYRMKLHRGEVVSTSGSRTQRRDE